MISKIWSLHISHRLNYQNLINNIFGEDSDCLETFSQPPKSDFEDIFELTKQNYKRLFASYPPEFIWKSYKDEYHLNNTRFFEVNLLRMVLYYNYEHSMLGKVHKYTDQTIEKEVNASLQGAIFSSSILNPHIVQSKFQFKHQFYEDNKKYRTSGIKRHDYHQYIWRKNYPKEVFDDIYSSKEEPSIFTKGGPKFLNTSELALSDSVPDKEIIFNHHSYSPKSHIGFKSKTQEFDIFEINLDDLADNACEGVHMYTFLPKYKEIGNNRLVRAMGETFDK